MCRWGLILRMSSDLQKQQNRENEAETSHKSASVVQAATKPVNVYRPQILSHWGEAGRETAGEGSGFAAT